MATIRDLYVWPSFRFSVSIVQGPRNHIEAQARSLLRGYVGRFAEAVEARNEDSSARNVCFRHECRIGSKTLPLQLILTMIEDADAASRLMSGAMEGLTLQSVTGLSIGWMRPCPCFSVGSSVVPPLFGDLGLDLRTVIRFV